jgi:hypothetical protein
MPDFDTAMQIVALIVGLLLASFGPSWLIDWLLSFHEPEEE